MTELDYLVPVAAGANFIGRSTRTVRRWISTGEIPVHRSGMVYLDDLERVRDENQRRMTRQETDDWVTKTIWQGSSSVTFTVGRMLEALVEDAPDADWSTLRITGGPSGGFKASVRLDRP